MPFESESPKIFRVESSLGRIESLRVTGLQAQVNVESNKIKHFSYVASFLNINFFTLVCSR